MSLNVSLATRLASLVGRDLSGLRFCVALSGGLDSTVLLHLLAQLAAQFHFQLSAVHVHHGLSANADAWAAHCHRLAESLQIPLEVRRVSVERDSADGLEAAARRARHAVFSSLDCDWVMLAHHRGDQAETVLHRLMRGSGVHGAAGMRPIDASRRLLRPLLDEPRARLLAWAQQHELAWIEDESNVDTRFTRNFLRNQVLPQLQGRHAGVESNLARAARLFDESAGLLDELAAQDAMRIAPGAEGSLPALRDLSEPRARNLLRHLLVKHGALPPTTDRLTEALRQIHVASQGLRLVFDGVALCAWRDAFWIEREIAPDVAELAWRGESQLAWSGGVLRFGASSGPQALRLDMHACVRVSARRGGERLRLRAGGPSRAFKQLAQESGIPPWQRDRLPCLWQDAELVWMGRIGANADWRCADGEPGWLLTWEDAGGFSA